MSPDTRASTLRRHLTGAALLLASPIGLIAALLTPNFQGGLKSELEFIAGHADRWLLSNVLMCISFALFIAALLGALQLFRKRGAVLAYVAAAFSLFGLYFHGMVVGFSLVEIPLVASGWDGALQFTETMYDSRAFTVILLPFLSLFVGLFLYSVAFWVARLTPAWVPLLIIGGAASNFVAPRAVSPEVMLILFSLAFGWLGWTVLRMPDEGHEESGLVNAEPDRPIQYNSEDAVA